MPSRWIREDILTSDHVDKVSDAGEVFYRRLLSVCDDYGLFDARLSILRAKLYPLRLERVTEADIAERLTECGSAGLIALYDTGGKPYLQVLRTRWQARSEPKFPLPPWGKGDPTFPIENSCKQLFPTVALNDNDKRKTITVPSGRKARVRASPKKPLPEDFAVSSRVQLWADEHGYAQLEAHLVHFVGYAKANGKTYADWDQALMNAIRNNWARIAPSGGRRDLVVVGQSPARSTRARSLAEDLNDMSWAM